MLVLPWYLAISVFRFLLITGFLCGVILADFTGTKFVHLRL